MDRVIYNLVGKKDLLYYLKEKFKGALITNLHLTLIHTHKIVAIYPHVTL